MLRARIKKAALLAYVTNLKDSEIAEHMSGAVSTVRAWKVRSEWTEAIGEIGSLHWSRSVNQLRAATLKAILVMEDLLDDKAPIIRLRAAQIILNRGLVVKI